MTTPPPPMPDESATGEVLAAIIDQIGQLTNLRNLTPAEVRVLLTVMLRMVRDIDAGQPQQAMQRAMLALLIEMTREDRFTTEPDPMNLVHWTNN